MTDIEEYAKTLDASMRYQCAFALGIIRGILSDDSISNIEQIHEIRAVLTTFFGHERIRL